MIVRVHVLFLFMCNVIQLTNSGALVPEIHGTSIVKALNDVLKSAPQYGDFVMFIMTKSSMLESVSDVAAPWGMSVFQVSVDHGTNITQAQLSHILNKARQLRQVSWSVTMVVVSDDPDFLASFAQWSLKGRLLVWSNRLLILTHLPLNSLNHIRYTLAMTNSMLFQITTTPKARGRLYMDLPFTSNTSEPITAGVWSPEKGLRKTSPRPYYYEKYALFSHRPRLSVARVVVSMYKTELVDDPDYPEEKKLIVYNTENVFVEAIAEAMNFSIKFVEPADGEWGVLRSDGSWSGMIGLVYRREVDFGLGLFTVTAQRYNFVDFTYPVFIDYLQILAGRLSAEVDPLGFLFPLTPTVWLAILAGLMGILAVTILLPLCLPVTYESRRRRLWYDVFTHIRVLLQQDVCKMDELLWWQRVVLGTWMLTMLALARSYTSNLITLLTVRKVPLPLQTFEDLVDSNAIAIISEGTAEAQAFMAATGGILKDVWDLEEVNRRYMIKVSQLSRIMGLVRGGKRVHINNAIYSKRRIAKDFSRTGQCDYYLGRGQYIPSMASMADNKGSPLLPALSHKVMQITEAGLWDYWEEKFTANLTTCDNTPTKFAVMSTLALKNVWVMFMILAGGMIAALIIFCLEILYSVFDNHNIFQLQTFLS